MGTDMKSAISTSKIGLCPNCHVVRNLRVNVEKQIQGEGGAAMELRTIHCETCGSFVSREIREVGEED